MDIYISKDDERLRFRVKKTSQLNNYFTISIVDNKPQLYGGWSKGAFGGSMNLSKVKLWSLFLRELKDAVMKNKLNYYKWDAKLKQIELFSISNKDMKLLKEIDECKRLIERIMSMTHKINELKAFSLYRLKEIDTSSTVINLQDFTEKKKHSKDIEQLNQCLDENFSFLIELQDWVNENSFYASKINFFYLRLITESNKVSSL